MPDSRVAETLEQKKRKLMEGKLNIHWDQQEEKYYM